MNQNVKDALYMSVEEYNQTITDPKRKFQFERMSDAEKKGIFYNTLRRNISFYDTSKLGSLVHLDIVLRPDGTILSLKLKSYGHDYWGETVRPEIFLREILKEKPTFETTAIKNEIADIVNSIKTS